MKFKSSQRSAAAQLSRPVVVIAKSHFSLIKLFKLMDLSKFQTAFDKMSYNDKTALKVRKIIVKLLSFAYFWFQFQVSIKNTKSDIVVTESCDLDAATDFISQSFQSEDANQIKGIFVQTAVEAKFLQLLKLKLKGANSQALTAVQQKDLAVQIASFVNEGFELIQSSNKTGPKSTIIRCPRGMIASDDLPIVTLEVFRTTKECISFVKASHSIGLWCENLSTAFEYINALSNARQIWLNSSHGAIHPKIPFFNGQVVCEDAEIRSRTEGATNQVAGNIQFSTTFRSNTFQTVVVPFGETFAN